MEPIVIAFIAGLLTGVVGLMLWNKLSSGSVSAKHVKHEYDEYQAKVEAHFEATSKKFQNMTEQYQDLYQHLSVGATSLCRPDSLAAALVDDSDPQKPPKLESKEITPENSVPQKEVEPASNQSQPSTAVDAEKEDKHSDEKSEKDETAELNELELESKDTTSTEADNANDSSKVKLD